MRNVGNITSQHSRTWACSLDLIVFTWQSWARPHLHGAPPPGWKSLKDQIHLAAQHWPQGKGHGRGPRRWWEKKALTPTTGFPGGSDGTESTCNAGDLDLVPGWGRSPGEGNGYPLQYSCLESSMDRVWWAPVHGFVKSRTPLTTNH